LVSHHHQFLRQQREKNSNIIAIKQQVHNTSGCTITMKQIRMSELTMATLLHMLLDACCRGHHSRFGVGVFFAIYQLSSSPNNLAKVKEVNVMLNKSSHVVDAHDAYGPSCLSMDDWMSAQSRSMNIIIFIQYCHCQFLELFVDPTV
jgi:hypothetical protein